jgi:ribosomal protein L23
MVKLTGYTKDAVVSLYNLTRQEIKTITVKPGTSKTGIAAVVYRQAFICRE